MFAEPPPQLRSCDHAGCPAEGAYRAPKSRDRLTDYWWLCLDHVREYNKRWDYYAGLSTDEIERMARYDTVWRRPTWPLGGWRHEGGMRERLYRSFGLGQDDETVRRAEAARRPQTEAERAMQTLELALPFDLTALKARYKALVKLHHPDANGGSREAEERLKTINHAYSVLKASFAA